MLSSRIFFLVSFIFLLTLCFSAQTIDEKAKEIQEREISLLEEILADADKLKLTENKALIYAHVGNKIWDINNKYARELFQNSIDELITAQKEAENETKPNGFLNNLIYGQNPRWQILNLISVRDAELALEATAKTRPAILEQMFSQMSKNTKSGSRYSNYGHYLQTELRMEHRYINLASRQNPDRMIELFRKNIEKGVSSQTNNMLVQINQKDPVMAKTLAEETIQKLLTLDLNPNNQNTNTILYFINQFSIPETTNNKQLRISDGALRSLVDKLSSEWLKPGYRIYDGNSNTFKAIERMFPDRANNFRQKTESYKSQNQNPEYKEYLELSKSDLPPQELLKKAQNLNSYRSSLIENVLRKVSDKGDVNEYTAILNSEFSKPERNRRLYQFYANRASRESSKGNFDVAYQLINEIPEEDQRFFPLIQLAKTIFHKNIAENKEQAASILRQVIPLLAEKAENQEEINKYINLANAYAVIEPNEAFRLIEVIIDPLNEYSKAYAVVSQFRNEGRTRNGEYLINMGVDATGQFNLGHVLLNLKNFDFEQTVQLINRFERLETRISFKLQMIRNVSGTKITQLPLNIRRFSSLEIH